METDRLSEIVKQKAYELGFAGCGISPVIDASKDIKRLQEWISDNYHADMAWIERSIPLRQDPALLLPDIKSVVVVVINYDSPDTVSVSDYKISKYALNKDYHTVIKSKLYQMLSMVQEFEPAAEGRIFVDSGPVFEKSYAVNAGLGWFGKNSCLILPKKGSFFFIGTMLLNIALTPDNPFLANHCGKCTRCIDACPTGALIAPYTVDASKCISYLTIEHKGDIPRDIDFRTTGQIFGCDLCQQACPFNKFSINTHEEDFLPSDLLVSMTNEEWETLTKSDFKKKFKQSPIQRAGYEKIKSTIAYINQTGD
jgi:epoxyqueuosine reductase